MGSGFPALALLSSLAVAVPPGVIIDTAAAAEPSGAPEQRANLQLMTDPMRIEELLERGSLRPEEIPDPHWRPEGCAACHVGRPAVDNLRVARAQADRLCAACHERTPSMHFHHPSGIAVRDDMLARMPASMRQSLQGEEGLMLCSTCHDPLIQCLGSKQREGLQNPHFLREGPYRDRTAICYLCHDAEQYKRLNVHDQISDSGMVRKQTCSVCHADTDGLEEAHGIGDLKFTVSGDLSKMCLRCHEWIPHPGGGFQFGGMGEVDHLTVPSAKVRARMEKMTASGDLVLPLEPSTGRVFCGTCHNPHERGVISDPALSRGSDSKQRLRDPKLCIFCHEK